MKFIKISLFQFILLSLLNNCTYDNPTETKSIKSDSIPNAFSECNFDPYSISYSNDVQKTDSIISKACAVVFFRINTKLSKYHITGRNVIDQDSVSLQSLGLPSRLLNPDRQEIYRMYEISGIYYAIIKPTLEKNNIPVIIDSVDLRKFIVFKGISRNYKIDLSVFNKDDGVLMFQPNRPPILWTVNRNRACEEETLVNCYFSNCP
jgi:hypothetical protein